MNRSRVHRLLAPAVIAGAVMLAVPNLACGKGDGATAAPSAIGGAKANTGGTGGTGPGGRTAEPPAKAKPDRGPERVLYSLVDNRLSAHQQRNGGLVIPAGSAGFVKYLRWRRSDVSWKLSQDHQGTRAAVMDGKIGRVDVPLTADQVKGAVPLRMRVHNDRERALTVRINGERKREIAATMAEGWSVVTVDAPEGLLRAGENEILLFTGKGDPMALDWLQVGGAAIADTPSFYDAKSSSLVLPKDGGMAYYVMIPPDGRVIGDVAGDGGGCQVQVTAATDDGKRATGTLPGDTGAVELSALAGKVARVELTAAGCPEARLAGAALAVPGADPKVKRGPPPKYVVLWVMDSLRADRVRPFVAGARPEAPTFDKLAGTGAVFTQAYVQGNESRVSHASIWSSLYPVKHNMITSKAKLDKKWTTIEEVARAAGMYTSGVSANGYADPKWGIGEAWDHFSNHIHAHKGLKGEDVLAAALETVDGKTDPWFLYIGTIDTHVSWRPKDPWITKYYPGYKGRFSSRFSGEDAGAAATGKLKLTDDEIKWVRALYDSNVSYQDDLLGQLMAKLTEWGIADETMVIVTADHGDEQWEDGRVGHGASLLDTLVHVPLLIHYPPMFPGVKVAEGAEVVDIVPTLADALGVDANGEWQGQSLVPVAHGVAAGYPRLSFASNHEGSHAGRIGPWKVFTPGSGTPRLSAVGAKPEAELTDVADKHPYAFRFVADPLWTLRAYNGAWNKAAWGNPANVAGKFPASFGE